MKISIICPLYKGEKYVDKIIEMINRNFDYCKTYIKNISVELIFINDYQKEHIQINKNSIFFYIRMKLTEEYIIQEFTGLMLASVSIYFS